MRPPVLREARVTAPAKINLSLGVGRVRTDGYHPLATVYQAVGLFDDVTVRSAPELAEDEVTVLGDGVDVSDVPLDAGNLALRAVRLLRGAQGLTGSVRVHVHKRIPVAGGLAGGSTDAAAALLAADALWGVGLDRVALLQHAAALGSDVPFCLVGGTALGSGRGELVTPVMTRGTYWWVVVPADGGLSTPEVYRTFDRLHEGGGVPEPEIPEALLVALRAGNVVGLGDALTNDLQGPALTLRPGLADLLGAGLAAGAHGALVSGSGPTTVYLAEGEAHARQIGAALQDAGAGGFLVARAPVPGAKVVEVRR